MGEVEPGLERVQRRKHGVAILESDVLDPCKSPDCLRDVPARKFVEASQDPLKLEQHGHRNEGSRKEGGDGRGALPGCL